MMSATLADLESWIDGLMVRKGITDYKLDFSGTTTKGDGYLGEINFIKVIAKPEKGKEKIYDLIIKSAKRNDEFRKQTPIREAYEREIFMYTKVLPILREFQTQNALEKLIDNFPKCYSANSENKREAIILKNLKTVGYDIHDRKVAQNLNHVLTVFRNYGKFHAMSLALRTKKPAIFRSLTKNMKDILDKFLFQSNMLDNFIDDFKTGINALKDSGKEHLAKKYDGFVDHMVEYLTKDHDPSNKQSVILHGDCWNNNMMFKYEEGNKDQPVGMCFIDFQLSTVASPVYDLSYYLYTCADKSVLDKFDFLLQEYYSNLSDTLKAFGCEAEDILTFTELKSHWKKYGTFGLSMAPLVIKLELCDSDEVVDFSDSAENGGLQKALSFQLKEQDIYKQRLVDVLSHFAENFL